MGIIRGVTGKRGFQPLKVKYVEPTTTSTPVAEEPTDLNAILREDGSYLLREDGSHILREA